jgi:hypothetical protein
MSDETTKGTRAAWLRNPVSLIGAIGLLAQSVGLTIWAVRLLILGDAGQLWAQFAILGILFAFSAALIVFGASSAGDSAASDLTRFFTYVYAILGAGCYLGIAYQVSRSSYSGDSYVGFWMWLVLAAGAVLFMRYMSLLCDRGWSVVPLALATLAHYLALAYIYLVAGRPLQARTLLENLAFALFMTAVTTVMYLLSELPGSPRCRVSR